MPDYEEDMRLVLFVTLLSLNLWAAPPFPESPNEGLTPGVVCDKPDSYRYPERIAYCERNVAASLKAAVIREYDKDLGFQVGSMNRQDFKIDHYIPLCMGGANEKENLWPQYKTVYVKTDPIEEKLCRLMEKGRMLQKEAIETIRHVKNNLDEADKLSRELDAKLR